MEALNIDNLKKKYGDENEEDKAKREKQLGIGASVNLGMSIAMIILGVWYDSEDKTGDATDFLKVWGAVLCVNSAMKVVSFMTPCKCDDKITAIMSPLLDIAYFIVVIWGSVHVFGKLIYGLLTLHPRQSAKIPKMYLKINSIAVQTRDSE